MDFQMVIAHHYLEVGIEIANFSDDLGMQNRLLLSPRIIQEFLVQEYHRLFDLYRSNGVIINFHSCGHIQPLLETFIELGVNILNPLQATANDLDEVRRVTQGRMALQGGVRSDVIVNGPTQAIRHEVAQRIGQLGRHGGYFCAEDQGMLWPEEHYQALELAVEEFGMYPIQVS